MTERTHVPCIYFFFSFRNTFNIELVANLVSMYWALCTMHNMQCAPFHIQLTPQTKFTQPLVVNKSQPRKTELHMGSSIKTSQECNTIWTCLFVFLYLCLSILLSCCLLVFLSKKYMILPLKFLC